MIKIILNDDEILSTYSTLRELRPDLDTDNYLQEVRNQFSEGYQMAAKFVDDSAVCVAGFRIFTNFAYGKNLFVDDLVTGENFRSKGYGVEMIHFLEELAREHECKLIHLDSGTHRKRAHQFYLGEKFEISAFHFIKAIN